MARNGRNQPKINPGIKRKLKSPCDLNFKINCVQPLESPSEYKQ